MNILFFIGDSDWTARARIFTTAAHGLAARDHQVTLACPQGPIIDHVDTKRVGIVRVDPAASTAFGTFDLRRVAQERSLDVAFVHTAREQLMVGSGMRFGKGGALMRRLGMCERRDDEPGLLTSRVAPARLIVSTEMEAAMPGNSEAAIVPLGVDVQATDAVPPLERRKYHLRDDAIVVACPYAPNGRIRLLNIMRTLALVGVRHPRLRAVVYGHRATDDDLRMQAAALGVAPLMQFVDGNRVDSIAVMKSSDFAWIAADHDAGALGCLDAMAVGRPVIAERSSVIDHFVADGINGTVLPQGDSPMLASAIATVMARGETRETFGTAGRARAQREFGLPAMIDGFERAATARAMQTTG
ncbi:MAG TPA: glycosyltransferase family 4 protein [Gemmatimonadaceae bacterium]|nr:glycosyltransferase family 4 protein [Gemmatimonadaceae bacterium]